MIQNRLTDVQIQDLYRVAADKAKEPYDHYKLHSIAVSNLIIVELLVRLNEKQDKDVQKKNLVIDN